MEVQPQSLQMPATPSEFNDHGRRTKSNSYDTSTPGLSKDISDDQQELLRKKQDVLDIGAMSPVQSTKSPHSTGQKAIKMPKAMAI
ncbi:unnamed protein product [Aphanomyces euteiches]|uniref:Uncharacterized protein n=1 Tax=Aphanomyces euteiches TaxID=100861 RepID=A0A6G0WTY1_9STRA|nr:hypothetical protein Ae201684_011706 [Aphanomyces euteiches]KAH9097141.1 hypothetical protein Ae201684P_011867 [Aphanomyces euteiches]KAH9116789.1 hypothetical protein AeMF1_009296 [Aphanomyces euteiches]KAH9132694.1 hypothetical protein LEN26_007309 [Aphanomyces euteiches]KAH9157182.1 hypothetical protein AeRB84_000951 [Aphanomyces euteiches]